MILIIDHKDSFTRNLEHQLSDFDQVYVEDRKDIQNSILEDASIIVFSPGPGKPDDYPDSKKIFHQFVGGKPILGICLGFQLILQEEGAKVEKQKKVLHGVQTDIKINTSTITYKGFQNNISVGRYHSLQVDPESLYSLKKSITITATDSTTNIPLSFEDSQRKLFGLQYHPESFLTPEGKNIIQNIYHASLDRIGECDRTS